MRRNSKPVKTSITKMEHYKISKLLNDSTVSKFASKKWIKINDFPITMPMYNLLEYNDNFSITS